MEIGKSCTCKKLVETLPNFVWFGSINQRPLRSTHGWDQMKVTERIRAVCSCFWKRAPCKFCHLSCFQLMSNQKNERVLQPDFRFWKARFAGKQCAQSRLVISHCLTQIYGLTAPHSSNHKDSQMLLCNIRALRFRFWGLFYYKIVQ